MTYTEYKAYAIIKDEKFGWCITDYLNYRPETRDRNKLIKLPNCTNAEEAIYAAQVHGYKLDRIPLIDCGLFLLTKNNKAGCYIYQEKG